MYYWAKEDDSMKKIEHELEIRSNRSVINWRNFFRDVCATYYINSPQHVGGKFTQIIIHNNEIIV